ncbi:MAG: methylmalonyl-CoA mutase family protein [Leptospira sp.]|nr:methylmalonyl-CoA mutase family protein [Leptospira sp.]
MEEILFSEFPEITNEDWKNTIVKDLKGTPYEKVQWKTEDGLTIEPFYRKSDLTFKLPNIKKQDRGWNITESIFENASLTLANEKAKTALSAGVNSLLFVSHAEGGKSFGVPINSPMDIPKLLNGIDLKTTSIFLSIANRTPDFAKEIRSLAQGSKQIFLDYDPLGTALLCGEHGATEDKVKSNLGSLSSTGNERFICVHSYYLRDAGASVSQELSYSLAWGLEYLNALVDSGVSPSLAAKSIWFWMGIGTDYFTEIAKIRAFRLTWSQILDTFEKGLGDISPAIIHASTSDWNYTAYDPYVNILRGTTEAMSAVLGGADFVNVSPFDKVYANANEFGVRIARNSQLLLKHEAYLDKVEDPSSGSYYLENLSYKLGEIAWKGFQDIEKLGGFQNALETGVIQSAIEISAKEKREAIASKKQTLLGTNQYPLTTERHADLSEKIAETKKLLEFPNNGKFKRILPLRLSYDFDRLRVLTDKHIESGKPIPKVFLLTIGDLNMRKARAGFSSNFIGCLGYEILDNPGFNSITDGISAAKNAKADIVVLCSSDEEYTKFLPEFADQIKKDLPKVWPIIAGYPKELIGLAEEKGISDFIHLKRNLIEFMEKAQARL